MMYLNSHRKSELKNALSVISSFKTAKTFGILFRKDNIINFSIPEYSSNIQSFNFEFFFVSLLHYEKVKSKFILINQNHKCYLSIILLSGSGIIKKMKHNFEQLSAVDKSKIWSSQNRIPNILRK